MITLKGTIVEVAQGMKFNWIIIQVGKARSKLKFSPIDFDIEEYNIGDNITIMIEHDATLFNKTEN